MEEEAEDVNCNHTNDGLHQQSEGKRTNGIGLRGSKCNIKINGRDHIEPTPLKSNLKKTTLVEANQIRTGTRKVSWPDAHGKDIAHVQEFEPSVWGDGELGGVQNSCVCVIQ